MSGATGIWASVCIEGSSMGNAASCVTLMNLIRLGNKKVLKKYNCTYLRKAAINVTRITTGIDPHIKQPIYGGRALDFVFDLNTCPYASSSTHVHLFKIEIPGH
jgi:isopropylmalate/homocitrate/citramalate synthase